MFCFLRQCFEFTNRGSFDLDDSSNIFYEASSKSIVLEWYQHGSFFFGGGCEYTNAADLFSSKKSKLASFMDPVNGKNRSWIQFCWLQSP